MNSEIEKIRLHYYSSVQSWNRGFRKGAIAGTLVTTLLLGGAVAFLWWIDRLSCM